MTQERVMLLIDADNVSVDIIEQAVALLLAEHGALHVRRAYCTAESAVQNQAVFKRLSIKPMVNLAAGKNSTDIAMAVDAMDLVLAERPDVVVIASSDSDFAPLVARLREKGCRVLGIGQSGKTGDETQAVYDAYTVLEHHKARPAARTASKVAKPAAKAAAKVPAKKAARRKAATPGAAALPTPTPVSVTVAQPPARAAEPAPPPARPAASVPEKVRQILQALPELARGDTVELQVAGERLRRAQLISQRGSSTKLFNQFTDSFELLPEGKPTRVRQRTGGRA
jgi:uncharacterized protein (TIGR00288 family)